MYRLISLGIILIIMMILMVDIIPSYQLQYASFLGLLYFKSNSTIHLKLNMQ